MDAMMEVAALGRPFSLGMLYDCRKDALIPGMTLWDRDVLKSDIGERPQFYNDFEIVTSDSIEDKSSALNVSASLKASFLSGLVEVGGAARYLKDTKTSKNQVTVTLNYKVTTKVLELSMNHLGKKNVKYPAIYKKDLATHVVTAILFGAQAFFVFEREVSDKEDYQGIKGEVAVEIKKIPHISIGGEGSIEIEEIDRNKVDKFSCRFYGDFCLQNPPTTFDGAIGVYKSLPKLLGPNGENAVPMKVWLLPLTLLDSDTVRFVSEISVGLVQAAQNVLEDFRELEMRCNDVLRTTIAQQFPEIGKDFKNFKEMTSQFKLQFQKDLAKKLPLIRAGKGKEEQLLDILKKRDGSPFNNRDMTDWINSKEREIYTLMSFTGMMKNTKIIQSLHDLHKESLKAKHVLCFVFTSLGTTESYLSALSNYLKETTEPGYLLHPHSYDIDKDEWYASKEVVDRMRIAAKLFSDFADANKENEDIRFLAVGLTNEKYKGSSIYFYKDGFSVSENFEPPSKPETVTVGDMNHNSVTLKISPPRYGAENVTSYSVEYRVKGEDGWKLETHPKSEEITVRDLRPNTEYEFRCRAIISAGVGPASDIPIRTEPCSPPAKPQVEPYAREMLVSWKKPAEIEQNIQIIGYIVEYAAITEEDLNVEALQWNQVMSATEKVIISELEPGTEYSVKVTCDCGAAGRSKESVTVNVTTTPFRCLKEHIKDAGKTINARSPLVYKLPLTEKIRTTDGCRCFNFGAKSKRPSRTVMLFGGTGSGKSTLINGMINYIIGVEWEDNFRFQLVDEAESQNTDVTVYKINHQDGFKIPFSLTIIDTSGLGDTADIARDKLITDQLHSLITDKNGVGEVDVVGFVVQADLTELPPMQKQVFDSVVSVLSNDVAENIRVLVTFIDSSRPSVLEAIKASGVQCPKADNGLPLYFTFNDSALFAHKKPQRDDDEGLDFHQMFWSMGAKAMKNFFGALNVMNTKNLTMRNNALRDRKVLESKAESLQEQIKLELFKKEKIRETINILNNQKSQKNTELEICVMKPHKDHIYGAGYFANCQQCHITCHYPLPASSQSDTGGCCEVEQDGFCTECPGKCPTDVHFYQKYKWEYKEFKEKQKHPRATEDELAFQKLLRNLAADEDHAMSEMKRLMESFSECLNKLKEKSADSLSTEQYIKLFIDGEEFKRKQGWEKRVLILHMI
ncbi:uncharacterized protein KZ484_021920 [Pholidichthys leucotaenia]